MKHDWLDASDENGILGPRKRRCRHCAAVQEQVTHSAWMRVTGYQWLPLAGRCKVLEQSA